MIPRNIELPDEVIAELTRNPVLLRWLSEIQSQLVTSTVELNGVGCTRIVWNDTGSNISALQEVDVDDGLTQSYIDSAGVVQKASPSYIEGRWIASSGGIASGDAREMTRIA